MTDDTRPFAAGDPGFGVYVHWPFCAQKCPYCDFNSHVRFGGWDEARFLAAYRQEIAHAAALTGPRVVSSIFFGGGTPSLMKPETVSAIIAAIGACWTLDPNAEITLEANPGSVEAGRFRGYRDAGVNRVSVGVQSLRDDELKKLGRIHSVAEAKSALAVASSTFERFSLDLIYARPGATLQSWRSELGEALAIAGEHVSLYQLTIEPDTPYAALHASGKLIVPDNDLAADLYAITQEMTGKRGLEAYEISNHARPGAESRHNLVYWRYGAYAGIGPGAHGRIEIDGQRHATVAERNPEAWCARVEQHGHGMTELTALTPSEQADELLLMGLRLTEGVDVARLVATGGVKPKEAVIDRLVDLGFIARVIPDSPAGSLNWRANELEPIGMCLGPGLVPDDDSKARSQRLRATPAGRFVLNAVVAELSKGFEPAGRMDLQSDAP